MRITWHCEKCGSVGSSENRLKPASVNEGRLARVLHDAVAPNCHPESSDIRVRIEPEPQRKDGV